MKKTRTIKIPNTAYNIKVTVKNTGDNYNQFASIFKEDKSLPLFGTCFKNTSTNKEITNWATERINAPHNQNILNS